MDFAIPVDHKVKLKESEKKDNYLDLARKLKKPWNTKVMIIPIVIGALGTVIKRLVKELGKRARQVWQMSRSREYERYHIR